MKAGIVARLVKRQALTVLKTALGSAALLTTVLALATRRWRGALAAAFVALVPFAAYYRLWLSGPRAQYLSGDTCGLYWPDLVYFYRALTHFQLPLWNPFERGGDISMLRLEPGSGGALSAQLAAGGLRRRGRRFAVRRDRDQGVPAPRRSGGLAMFAWLRRRGLAPAAAVIGGVVYELGP